MAKATLGTYEIKVGDHTYEIQGATEQQAKELAEQIREQIDSGNPDLAEATFAHNAQVELNKPSAAPESVMETFGREGRQGGTFNLADEAASALAAMGGTPESIQALSGLPMVGPVMDVIGQEMYGLDQGGDNFWETFQRNMQRGQDQRAANAEENPAASLAGNVSGGLALAPVMGPGAVASTPARTIARSGAMGAGAGAVSGAGAGDTLENRELGAGGGAVFGGILGTAGAALITKLAPVVGRYCQTLRGTNTEQEAVRQIAKNLTDGGLIDPANPTDVAALREVIGSFTGKPVSIADLTVGTRRQTADALDITQADQAIDAILARNAGAGARLKDDVLANVAPRNDVYALNKDLVAQRAETATTLKPEALMERTPPEIPMELPEPEAPDAGLLRMLGGPQNQTGKFKPMDESFIAAMQEPAPAVPAVAEAAGPPAPILSPRMAPDIVNRMVTELPLAQKALKGAIERSRNDRALRQLQNPDDPLTDLPEMLAGQPLDYRTADYLKRFLDDEVNALAKRSEAKSFSAAEYQQVKELRNAIRKSLKDNSEEYEKYLDSYSTQSDMINALEKGPNFDNLPVEQIAAEQAARGTAAQELYRVGAARELTNRIDSAPESSYRPANKLGMDEGMRARLAAAGVPEENVGNLSTAVDQERQLAKLLEGIRSGRRGVTSEMSDREALALPYTPNALPIIGSAVRWARNTINTKGRRAVAEAALPRLINQDPQAIEGTILELVQQGRVAEANALRRQLRAERSGFVAGNIIGSPISLQEEY